MLIGLRPACDNETVFVSPEAVLTVRVPLRELVLALPAAVKVTEILPAPVGVNCNPIRHCNNSIVFNYLTNKDIQIILKYI